MTIQQKTFFIILLGLVGTIGVIYSISHGIVMSSFQQLEIEYVRVNTQRVYQVLANELEHVSAIAEVQSDWEELFMKLGEAGVDQAQKNFIDKKHDLQRYNLIVFFGDDGSLLYGRYQSDQHSESQALPEAWQADMSAGHPLVIRRDNKGHSRGLLKMPDGSALMVNSKMIKGADQLSRGTVVVGQVVNSNIVRRLGQVSNVSIDLLPFDQAQASQDNSDFYKSLSINAPYKARIADEQTINGFLLLKDIHNQPAFILKVSFPRDIYLQGIITLNYYTKLLLLVGITTVLFVLLLMNQLVLSRLKRLSRGIRKVTASGDLNSHIKIDGNDEFNYLAESFNELLDSLQLSREKIEKQISERLAAEKEIRKSHSLYNQAELIGKLGYWEWDLENDCLISCSEQFARIYDMTIDEALNRFSSQQNELDAVHEDDRTMLKTRLQDAFVNKQSLNIEYRIVTSSGDVRYVHRLGRILDDSDNRTRRCVGTLQDITRQKEAQAKLESYQIKLRSLMSELALVEETERRRISTELHDNTVQNLGLSKFRLSVFKDTLDEGIATHILDEVIETIDKAIKDTRNLIFELSPPILYELGFVPAIEWLAEKIHLERGLICEVNDDGENKPLDNAISVILFQSIRELLINVVKHAKAAKATITISRIEQRVRIEVSDDGTGFDTAALENTNFVPQGFGLFSIRERLSNLGAELEIHSSPGCGTRISFTAPLLSTDWRAA